MPEKLCIGLILQGDASWMGGVEYSRNLINALYCLPEDFELLLLSERKIDARLYADMPDRFRRDLHEGLSTPPLWVRAGRRLWPGAFASWTEMASRVRRLGVQFLYPFNRPPADYGQIGCAAWIPDFQHKYLPAFFSEEDLDQRERAFADYARHAPMVVLSSENAADDFRRFYPDAAHKARVLPFATAAEDAWFTADAASVAHKYELPERYFIVCNQFWQHKNHRVVFEALGLLKQRAIEPTIVCTGKREDYRRPEYFDEVERMLDEFQVRGQVRMLGLIPRFEQIQLMRRALAVVQPSLFEGWSTVVEDGRALGKRLALSDLPVHREQNPPGAIYFPQRDADRLAEILANWWASLTPGPENETDARRANRVDLEAFGRRFLTIASSLAV